MVSEKPLEANRRNTQKSTRPGTIEGKSNSSRNNLPHGPMGNISILPIEHREAHDPFCNELIDSFTPETPMDRQLANSIAEDGRRLNRARAIENNTSALLHSHQHREARIALADAATFLRQAQHDHELPAVRGCTWVVPAADELKMARKLDLTDKAIANPRAAIVKAPTDSPLDPEALRVKVGNAARNLMANGAKKGLTTPLPVGLGLLKRAGEIRRIPVNCRSARHRYRDVAWKSGPGVKAAKAAVEPLHPVDIGKGALLLPEDQEAVVKFQSPKRTQYALVRSLHHAIPDSGRLIGSSEFDIATGATAWALSRGDAGKAPQKAVHTIEAFVRDDLGDARSFSLDSSRSRARRIEALRKAAHA